MRGTRRNPLPGRGEASPELSIVVPAYEEEENVGALYEAVRRVMDEEVTFDWELVFVDDGSRDRTWERVLALNARDPRVRGVRLSRNFGHQGALMAGMEHAGGRAVITMDADLQHPPSLIPALVEAWRSGYEIVHTVRREAPETSWLKRSTSRWFYRLFSFLSGVRIKPGMADFRLLDRSVLKQIFRFGERELFLRALVLCVGYRDLLVEFDCGRRHAGTTKYSLRKMLSFAWHGITSFSLVPLRLATLVGLLTSALAFGFLIYALVAELGGSHTVPGWASGVSIISFLLGVLFILLGIMGEYLGKILTETKHRPRYLVRQQVGSTEYRRTHLPPLPLTGPEREGARPRHAKGAEGIDHERTGMDP